MMGYTGSDGNTANNSLNDFGVSIHKNLRNLAANVQEIHYFSLHFRLVYMPEYIQTQIEYLVPVSQAQVYLRVVQYQTFLDLIEVPDHIHICHTNWLHVAHEKPINVRHPLHQPLIQTIDYFGDEIRYCVTDHLQDGAHIHNILRSQHHRQDLVEDVEEVLHDVIFA